VPSQVPTTIIVIASVAMLRSGASMAPTMPPVDMITALLPPASACVTASSNALRLARRSSMTCGVASATADIERS
jgi:hypothetical protein